MTQTDVISPNASPGFHIIVADDNRTNLLVLKGMLKKLGFVPETAVNGTEAVALASSDVPTLILMDIHMPEMNGIEAAITIRQRHPDARISIVAVTAYPESRHQQEYKLAKFDMLIAKPVNLTTLKEIVEQYLGDAAPMRQ